MVVEIGEDCVGVDLLELSHGETGLGHRSEPGAQACLPLLLHWFDLTCLRLFVTLLQIVNLLGITLF